MHWLLLAVLTALCLAFYNFFIKLAANHISPAAGAVILQLVAAALGAGWLLWLRLKGQPVVLSAQGVGLAMLAGAGVGLAEILTFVVFGRGVPSSVGTPVIVGGSVLLTAGLGLLLLRESLTWPQAAGLVCIVVGIALLARGH